MSETENQEECSHDCSSCASNCAQRQEDMHEMPNALSSIGHVIGVVSGKGGVGKSLVTSMLSVLMQRKGYHVGIIDADITGPSIPKAFALKEAVQGDESGMIPPRSTTGIDMISANLMLADETAPVIMRGPMIAGLVKQFWTDVIWNDVDYLFVDCPPGTGDVPLTVFQTVKLDGIVIVASPQDLVSMIVSKAANMAQKMNIPVLGLVENMSYVKCPDCSKEIKVFGESHINEVAQKFGYDVLARIPMDPKLSALVDRGMIELMDVPYLDAAADVIEAKTQKKDK